MTKPKLMLRRDLKERGQVPMMPAAKTHRHRMGRILLKVSMMYTDPDAETILAMEEMDVALIKQVFHIKLGGELENLKNNLDIVENLLGLK